MSTQWDISTDIYGIRSTVEDLKKRYIDNVDEETLALGIFGFIGDVEAKKIQVATIMTGQLGNEMFATRAKLSKNVLTHAIYQNISDINARPAELTIQLAIKVSDMELYMTNNQFVFDRTCPIMIDSKYEFHLDYDVILQKTQNAAMVKPVYSARYDMSHHNPISNVTTPYLGQPYVIHYMNDDWVIFAVTIRQTTIEWIEDQLITDSIIDNKTFLFNFSDQLAGFYVYITENGKTTRLTPYFVGAPVEDTVENYCRYLYLNDDTVRISFDSLSYLPGLNAKILVEAYTTLGESGNFLHSQDAQESTDFVDFYSDEYGYGRITCYCRCQTDSVNGRDRKSIEDLRKLTPKFALSRGYITTETDLNNYFNLINTDQNRLKPQKKVDNQLERIWYVYFLIKDDYGNIIPTNTLPIEMDTSMDICYSSDDGRMVLPAGTIFSYTKGDSVAKVVTQPSEIPDGYSDMYFAGDTYYYMSVYNCIINPDPLYAAFYMGTLNENSFFIYDWVNEDCELQFMASRNNIRRKLLSDSNIYRLTYTIQQSVLHDYGMISETETEEGETVYINKIRCILIMYREGIPYRYAEAKLTGYDTEMYTSNWEFEFVTDNSLDNENFLKLLDLGVIGSEEKNYGFFENRFRAQLYILGQYETEYGRYDLDGLVPGLDGWSVSNVYELENGMIIYKNYTTVMNTKVDAVDDHIFHLTGIPMVGYHYMEDEDHVSYFMDILDEKKAYIDNCLKVVENSFDIDLKYFNTYGPSLTYSIGDEKDTDIGSISINMKFRMSLVSSSDIYTKDKVIQYIKEYIENINDIGDLHIPNLLSDIREKFSTSINWIEYMNFNDLWLGINHIILRDIKDPHVVPEFINIRNHYNDEGLLEPCIEIETVNYGTAKK